MPTGPDEWTVPDSFEPNEATIALAQEEAPKQRFFVESFSATRPVTLAREVNDNAGKTSDVSEDIGGLDVHATSDVFGDIGGLGGAQ